MESVRLQFDFDDHGPFELEVRVYPTRRHMVRAISRVLTPEMAEKYGPASQSAARAILIGGPSPRAVLYFCEDFISPPVQAHELMHMVDHAVLGRPDMPFDKLTEFRAGLMETCMNFIRKWRAGTLDDNDPVKGLED